MLTIMIWYLFIFLATVHHGATFRFDRISNENDEVEICSTESCIRAAAAILSNIDTSEDPCVDFYQFACGGFETHNFAYDKEIHVDVHLDNQMKPSLRKLLTMHNQPSDLLVFRQMRDFYESCIHTSLHAERGLSRLQELLNKFGGWPMLLGPNWNDTDFRWEEVTSKLTSEGLDITSLLGVDLFFNYDLIITDNYRVIQIRDPMVLSKKPNVREAYRMLLEEVSKYLGVHQDTASDDINGIMYFLDEYTKVDFINKPEGFSEYLMTLIKNI